MEQLSKLMRFGGTISMWKKLGKLGDVTLRKLGRDWVTSYGSKWEDNTRFHVEDDRGG